MSANWSFETRQIHAGQTPDPTTGAQALPIYQTNAYVFDNAGQAAGRFALSELGPIYTRITNPTQEVVENRLADLEGGVGALLLASGQAANTFAILNLAGAGDNIVASPSLYGGTFNLLANTLPKLGITVTFVEDPYDLEQWREAAAPNTKAFFGETIPNPKSDIFDIEGVAAVAHEVGVPLIDPNQLSQHVQFGLLGQRQVTTDYCMGCHGPPGKTLTFPNGDELSISIDQDAFHASVHGVGNDWQQLECNDCHENYTYPHPPLEAGSAREYTIEKTELCARCHQTQQEGHMEGVHAEALAEGNLDAATCVDCHSAHYTPVPNEPRSRIPETCRNCHSTVFDDYAVSVHGTALLTEENPDVPTCIECHGVHNINAPTTALFRNRSPELCASCHADREMMSHYDISIDVFETYVDDFHGTTVNIFQSNDPNTPTNKAVCYDCHGVHAIMRVDDPDAGIKENLLVTCQQCHPDATTNFSDSWTGHHRPSLRDNPLMFLVTIFYAIVIPSTVAFLGFLVGSDVYRKMRGR